MQTNKASAGLLADFCSVRTVLLVAIIMVLLAIVILLVPGHEIEGGWERLGILSLFLQWLGLLSLAVLCAARPLLRRMNLVWSAILTFILIQLVTLATSEAVYLIALYQPALAHLKPEQHGLFLLRNLATSMIISGVALRYLYIQRQLQRQIRAETQARIQALQARIRPHFLFNSMNTIAALTHTDASAAEKAIVDLSEIYRATLNADDTMTTVEEEINLAQHYLEVEALRLHDRLRIDWQIDAAVLPFPMPRLMLQPLVENAVYHGIEPRPQGGEISISARLNGKIRISITNPLPDGRDKHLHEGNQVAMQNIRDRLQITYGKLAALTASRDNGDYTVELELPLAAKGMEDTA